MTPSSFRTDRNNNPAAFTTDIAREAGLILGKDYQVGDPFTVKAAVGISAGEVTYKTQTYFTAHLLGDPIALTIQTLDKIGFFTTAGSQRWTYIGIESDLWKRMTTLQKTFIISIMYLAEGGKTLKSLFTAKGVS